ncbi:trehalose corynomycolyl transferase A [Corynebacterium maris DSM 45190]|uniref:Trehalose corynomycolyl transferase A n=1 Tax=Corynebacterium maris DSM 45190 TaxID=1224163 RepID=S5SS35_9CORY|nr:alpha/beta hydrolase family protein [Corynebacterium maris]AGS33847.1 trehalose corynomycolyl transferase A [Corynebacterium maris DSM 45190]
MKFLRALAVPAAALALTFGAVTPVAGADTPSDVVEDATTGTATPADPTEMANGQAWGKIAAADDRVDTYEVYSTSMERQIPVAVIPATDEADEPVPGAPTIYLLNGAGGAEQDNDWLTLNKSTDGHEGTIEFYSGKGVNVVIPMAGAFSYYLDWVDTPKGNYLNGPQMWETFLTKELPGPIEAELKASNDRGIIGFSMSASSALLMAENNPGYYDAVGAFSGCYAMADPVAHMAHGLTVERGGGTMDQMVGPAGSPASIKNDALLNAGKLADTGTEIYVSNSSGLAGETDMAGYYTERGADLATALANSAVLQVEGGVIEAFTNKCTHDLKAKLDAHGVPANFNFRNVGTHSWPTWRDDISASWPTFENAFFSAE